MLDASFGTAGKVTSGVLVGLRGFDHGDGPDGKIIVAGDNPFAEDFMLARYNANGTLDTSFGNGGQLTTDIAAPSSRVTWCCSRMAPSCLGPAHQCG